MRGRTLVFVDRAADAGPPDPSVDVVVLDPWWTPGPGERPDLVPLRPLVGEILDRVDVAASSLEHLDEWAEASRMADSFVVDGATWWFRVRMAVRWDLQELMLWRFVLAAVAVPGRHDSIVVPQERPRLLSAARAVGRLPNAPAVVVAPPVVRPAVVAAPRVAPVARVTLAARIRRRWRRIVRSVRGWEIEPSRRAPRVDARFDRLLAKPPRVLALAWAGAFQVLETNGRRRFVDPHLALVLDRVARRGVRVATIAMSLNPRRDRHWAMIADDPGLVPHALVRERWERPEDEQIDAGPVAAALAEAPPVPLDIDGCDLGPEMRSAVEVFAGSWLEDQRRWVRWAERCLSALRPGVLFLDREGTRTIWIAAAHRLGIPVVSVQHGMIYPGNPEFCQPLHPAMLRPDHTCVFGPFERDILVSEGGYDPAQVTVTGSPRAASVAQSRRRTRAARRRVREELGIADEDRLLVVSVAHNTIGELHSATMVARLLGGPLPGIHLVIKLHPQDATEGGYDELLGGLARAGGYAPPRLNVVRDIDLYRLLRAADAHLGQDSTVLTDAVVAGIPNMIAVGQAHADSIGYVAAGVAVPVGSLSEVRAFMADPRPPTDEARSRFMEAHFRPGDAVGRVTAVLLEAAASVAPGR